MKKSDSIKELATALSKAQAGLKSATKNSLNPFFKSHYADLSSVWDAARPALAANGLSVTQLVGHANEGRIGLDTILMHSSGEWIAAHSSLPMKDETPQGAGSALTYLRRYALAAILGIVADEDDDGNAASKSDDSHTASGTKKPDQTPRTLTLEWQDIRGKIKTLVDAKKVERAWAESLWKANYPDNPSAILKALEELAG